MKKHLRPKPAEPVVQAAPPQYPMRISTLDPRWLTDEAGKRIGFTIMCPCCLKNRLTIFSIASPPMSQQVTIMHRALGTTPEDEDDWPLNWVPAKRGCAWKLSTTEDFETLTVHPSIDASASGNWHGWVKAGAVTL